MMLKNAVTIREITPDDFLTIAKWLPTIPLWQRYGVSYSTVTEWFSHSSLDEHSILVADSGQSSSQLDGQACGMVWCIPKGGFGRSAYIRILGVRTEFSGHGIGTQLLAVAEERAMLNSSDMFLLVSDFNVAAQRFYQRHGYNQIGQIDGYVLPDISELIYRKQLITSE